MKVDTGLLTTNRNDSDSDISMLMVRMNNRKMSQ